MKLLHKGDRGEILMLSASNFFARFGLFRQSEPNPEGFRRFGRVLARSSARKCWGVLTGLRRCFYNVATDITKGLYREKHTYQQI